MKQTKKFGQVCAVIGGQWGDEGKGKLVDILAGQYDVIVRATGGANAGHTIYVNDQKFVFHLIPAGMLHPGKTCVMGNGMVIHLPTLLEEMQILERANVKIGRRLLISDRAHLTFDYHKVIDNLQEELKGGKKVGTTGRGIGPSYTDKISRIGVRMGELQDFEKFAFHYRLNLELLRRMYGFKYDGERELKELRSMAKRIKPLITDTSLFLDTELKKKRTLLLEGANGTLLDIDHGTYPFVTSSNAAIGGIISGSGVPPSKLSSTIGIMKAYVTRVGSGPFPTELENEIGENIRKIGGEFGATTGRPRRCGWFDVPSARYACRLNGFAAINLTKIDILNLLPEIRIGVAYRYRGKRITEFPTDLSVLQHCKVEYVDLPGWGSHLEDAKTFEDLPKNCQKYIKTIEKFLGVKVAYIGTGKHRHEMIVR